MSDTGSNEVGQPGLRVILSAFAALLMAACVSTSAPLVTPETEPVNAPKIRDAGFEGAINSFRNGAGLKALRRSAILDRAAQAHADDMIKRSYFSHSSPNGPNGAKFSDRARAAGCALQSGAENIAAGQSSEKAVFEAWESSRGHRRNMLGGSYTQYGLGRSSNTWVLLLAGGC